MPADSTVVEEEGVLINNFQLVIASIHVMVKEEELAYFCTPCKTHSFLPGRMAPA